MPQPTTNQPQDAPWVEVIEQPSSKSTRFRYECEGRFAGSILGRTSNTERKTYPAIKVHNHSGACVVVVSLVTHDDDKPRPHPHTLVGPECRQGVCTKKVKQNLDCIQFPNLGIQCKKKNELADALNLRKQIRVDPFRTGFDHMEKPAITGINLMAVKLCFQVFLPDESGKYQRPVQPVCSEPILDKKSANDLVIHSFLPESCHAESSQGREMILLTGKLPKADDLEVRFYEGSTDRPVWEAFGQFTQKDIHQSVAITIKIPVYKGSNTARPKAQVMVQLRKKSNPFEKSSALKFFYLNGDNRNHRLKREHPTNGQTNSFQPPKKIKNDPGQPRPCTEDTPAVLEGISFETGSSGGSAFNQYTPQGAAYPVQHGFNYEQQQGQQYMPQAAPYSGAHVNYNGQEYIQVRASDVKIYRSEDSGKLFFGPGPTALNQTAPDMEVPGDIFSGDDIDNILRAARDNPDSEIYIPSNLSEHLNQLLQPTVEMMGEGEMIQSTEVSDQLHTSSLTKELKDIPPPQ